MADLEDDPSTQATREDGAPPDLQPDDLAAAGSAGAPVAAAVEPAPAPRGADATRRRAVSLRETSLPSQFNVNWPFAGHSAATRNDTAEALRGQSAAGYPLQSGDGRRVAESDIAEPSTLTGATRVVDTWGLAATRPTTVEPNVALEDSSFPSGSEATPSAGPLSEHGGSLDQHEDRGGSVAAESTVAPLSNTRGEAGGTDALSGHTPAAGGATQFSGSRAHSSAVGPAPRPRRATVTHPYARPASHADDSAPSASSSTRRLASGTQVAAGARHPTIPYRLPPFLQSASDEF